MARPVEVVGAPPDESRSAGLLFNLASMAGRFQAKRAAALCIRQARQYETAAAGFTAAQITERGKSLLAAGQSYINGRQPEAARVPLETAQQDLETYFRQHGTWDAYAALASTYQALEFTYKRTGRIGLYEMIHNRAVALAVDVGESHFGLQTTFLPDSSRMISCVAPPLPALE